MTEDHSFNTPYEDVGDWSDSDSLFGGCGKGSANDGDHDALELELATMLAEDSDSLNVGTALSSQHSMVSQPTVQSPLPSTSQLSLPAPSVSTSLLTLPGATEAGALPSHPVSCSAFPVRAAPVDSFQALTEICLALPSRPLSQYSPPSRISTTPDPLDVSLSRQDGHTSGNSVVSTPHLTHLSPTASTQASEEDAELEALMEWELLRDHDVNSTSRSFGDHGGLGLDPKLIPGNRYAHTLTHRDLRPPRRIDMQETKPEALTPFLFFRNKDKMADLYARLELKIPEGKKLTKALKDYLRNSPFDVLLNESSDASVSKSKESLVKTALHILAAEGWGEHWFGKHSPTSATRKQFWPTDSTLVTMNFTALLHKTIRNEKQVQRNQARRNNDGWGSESVASSDTGSRTASITPQPLGGGPALLDALVRNATSNKQKIQQMPPENAAIPVEVPADADLTYRVYVKDNASGVDLSAPMVYQHSNQEIVNGAYGYLTSSFETAGYSPIIMIHTANRSRCIRNQGDWDSAVREVYWWRSRGGVVEVDILV